MSLKGESEVAWTGPSVLTFQITPTNYLLGIADLTGELMRMCISSVGNGDIDTPFQLSGFLREIHDGFAYIGNTGPYEVSKKLHTLRQSLGKVEDACYTLRVRGSEIPKHMLADVFTSRAVTAFGPGWADGVRYRGATMCSCACWTLQIWHIIFSLRTLFKWLHVVNTSSSSVLSCYISYTLQNV